jgi:hypothetical protein
MKLYIRLFAFCLLIIFVGYTYNFSQSFQFREKKDTVNGTIYDPSDSLYSKAIIKNVSLTPKNVKLKLLIHSITAGHQIDVCWGNCFGPKSSDYIYPVPVTIKAGGTNEPSFPFDPVLLAHNTPGVTIVEFVFYDEENENDSISYIATYNVVSSDVEDNLLLKANTCTVSPNPANEYININFEQQYVGSYQKADIFNVAGVLTMTVSLNDLNVVNIPVAGLNEGVYYCRLTCRSGRALFVPFVISR